MNATAVAKHKNRNQPCENQKLGRKSSRVADDSATELTRDEEESINTSLMAVTLSVAVVGLFFLAFEQAIQPHVY